MSELDRILSGAVESGAFPFAVAGVATADEVLWQGSVGQANATHAAGGDTMFRIFSQTKGIGALATMVAIDRGLLTPDTTAVSICPEFAKIQVMEGMSPEGPIMRKPKRDVTVRDLLTHQSGFAYDTWNQGQADFQEFTKIPWIVTGEFASLYCPLQFDPGEGWVYGMGYDWVGRMIETASGVPMDQFCDEAIFGPLAMPDTSFELDHRADRLADLWLRGEDGTFGPMDLVPPSHPEFYGLGGALFSSAPDYLRFTQAILGGGQYKGTRIASEESMRLLYENQMGDASVPKMETIVPWLGNDVQYFAGSGIRMTHTLGFFRNESDVPGMRSAGSLTWAGAANTHYWIDPAKNISAVLMTQTFPFFEDRFIEVYNEFERAVYREFATA